MLIELRIENFAIIPRLELRFGSGLVTLTGETGAGKSILLDAITALVGGKQEYIQLFEVNIPKGLDLDLLQEKLRKRGQEMGVGVDLQHREIFRAINQI